MSRRSRTNRVPKYPANWQPPLQHPSWGNGLAVAGGPGRSLSAAEFWNRLGL
jgi:hypothetical protein